MRRVVRERFAVTKAFHLGLEGWRGSALVAGKDKRWYLCSINYQSDSVCAWHAFAHSGLVFAGRKLIFRRLRYHLKTLLVSPAELTFEPRSCWLQSVFSNVYLHQERGTLSHSQLCFIQRSSTCNCPRRPAPMHKCPLSTWHLPCFQHPSRLISTEDCSLHRFASPVFSSPSPNTQPFNKPLWVLTVCWMHLWDAVATSVNQTDILSALMCLTV